MMAENDVAPHATTARDEEGIRRSIELEETIRRSVGERIRLLREQSGLTQKELGLRAGGIKPGEISRYENAHRSPSLETMARIAVGLGISVSTLVDIESNDDPSVTLNTLVERIGSLDPDLRGRVVAVVEVLVRELSR